MGIVAALSHTACAHAVDSRGTAPFIEPEVRRLVGLAPARVIVDLGAPSGSTTIAQLQNSVIVQLPPGHFTVLRQYDELPLLALEIDDTALSALQRMGGLVRRVLADQAVPPSGR